MTDDQLMDIEDAAIPNWNADTMVQTLTTDIEVRGSMMSTLAWRQHNGRDIRLLGVPYVLRTGGAMQPLSSELSKYIMTLTGIPLAAVDQLSAADWTTAMGIVMSFFGVSPPSASSSSISSKLPGGAIQLT